MEQPSNQNGAQISRKSLINIMLCGCSEYAAPLGLWISGPLGSTDIPRLRRWAAAPKPATDFGAQRRRRGLFVEPKRKG